MTSLSKFETSDSKQTMKTQEACPDTDTDSGCDMNGTSVSTFSRESTPSLGLLGILSAYNHPVVAHTSGEGTSKGRQISSQKAYKRPVQAQAFEEEQEGDLCLEVSGTIHRKNYRGYSGKFKVGDKNFEGMLYLYPETQTNETIKKRKYRKRASDHPKRNNSAYNFFVAEKYHGLKIQYPDNKELFKVIGEQWKNLTEEERKNYDERAASDKVRYHKEMEKYKTETMKLSKPRGVLRIKVPVREAEDVQPAGANMEE